MRDVQEWIVALKQQSEFHNLNRLVKDFVFEAIDSSRVFAVIQITNYLDGSYQSEIRAHVHEGLSEIVQHRIVEHAFQWLPTLTTIWSVTPMLFNDGVVVFGRSILLRLKNTRHQPVMSVGVPYFGSMRPDWIPETWLVIAFLLRTRLYHAGLAVQPTQLVVDRGVVPYPLHLEVPDDA